MLIPSCVLAALALLNETKEIAPGVYMHRISMGTCCGSDTTGVPGWIAAGGRGFDSAYDYGKQVSGGQQSDLAKAIAKAGMRREDVFITTKIPAGLGVSPQDCLKATVESTVEEVRRDVTELNTTYVDLILLHAPCPGGSEKNAILWKGLEEAKAQGLVRSIGVSNYKVPELTALLSTATVVPAVNQCGCSVQKHDDETIAFCQSHNITYEAYDIMKGCPFDDATVKSIAAAHSKTAAQVCLRWALQRDIVVATGTGTDPTKAVEYAKEDLDVYDFELTPAEMDTLNGLGEAQSELA